MPRSGRTVAWAMALGMMASVSVLAAASTQRPNVIVIMVDDMGFSDLGCYGSEIHTPNLDRMAAQGLRFTQFYNTAKCETSRQSLMSGLWHPLYRKEPGRNFMTVAEVMRGAGYTTLMTGKWHIDGDPLSRGFDRYFGHLSGATDFFFGDSSFRLDDQPFTVPEQGFYNTDANTDYAMRFVTDAVNGKKDKPFFLYIAYNAPHYPLQAPKEEIDKYRGKYRIGWDELRRQRYARQLEMGLIDAKWPLSPRPGTVKPWTELNAGEQDDQDLKMATYAAMIDRLDQNIGRLMARLKELGVDQNTVLMFFSDNGGCPFDRNKKNQIPPWQGGGHWTYDASWAGASNTPFRWYKQNNHEGGIASPMIVHWPAGITRGRWLRQNTGSPGGHPADLCGACRHAASGGICRSEAGAAGRPSRWCHCCKAARSTNARCSGPTPATAPSAWDLGSSSPPSAGRGNFTKWKPTVLN
jgi:arylsulfatase A-like enzyme